MTFKIIRLVGETTQNGRIQQLGCKLTNARLSQPKIRYCNTLLGQIYTFSFNQQQGLSIFFFMGFSSELRKLQLGPPPFDWIENNWIQNIIFSLLSVWTKVVSSATFTL